MALNNRQLQAVDLLVYTNKLKQEIAEEVGVSGTTMSTWLKKPEFQDAIKAEMARAFQPLAYKARRRLEGLIESENEQVALSASKDALDRAGYGATQKVENTITGKEINIEITGD
jgi:transposase